MSKSKKKKKKNSSAAKPNAGNLKKSSSSNASKKADSKSIEKTKKSAEKKKADVKSKDKPVKQVKDKPNTISEGKPVENVDYVAAEKLPEKPAVSVPTAPAEKVDKKPAKVKKEKKPLKEASGRKVKEPFSRRIYSAIGLKTKTDYVVCMIGAAIIVALIILAVLLFCGVFQSKESVAAMAEYYGRDEPDMSVSLISSTLEEQKIMSDEMKLDFNNAKFDFYSLLEYEYSDAETVMPLSFANPAYNDCILVFTLTDGEGEVLYRSLGVRPGYVISYVSLSRNIPYGENDLNLYVTAFKEQKGKGDEVKFKKIGNSIATLKLTHVARVEEVTQLQ